MELSREMAGPGDRKTIDGDGHVLDVEGAA